MLKRKQDNCSFWVQSLAASSYVPPASTARIAEQYDVAIIGGGFNGLWLAYYLKQADAALRIAIFESHHITYGASGRNSGWLSPHLHSSAKVLLQDVHTDNQFVRVLQRHMIGSVGEVLRVATREGIDCDAEHGGMLVVATNAAQSARLQRQHQQELDCGFQDEELQLLPQISAQSHIRIPGLQAALYYQHGARVQPAKLAMGLMQCVEAMGVHVFENTPVQAWQAGKLSLASQDVAASHIICCAEAYANRLLQDQKVTAINAAMLVTKPLPAAFWQEYGWLEQYLLADMARLPFYAQKTSDGRIAFGGGGIPYEYGGGDAGEGILDGDSSVYLYRRLSALFPDYPFVIENAWRASLGVTRNGTPSVSLQPQTGLGWMYGLGSIGLGASNLAARIMVDKIMGQETVLTTLPWNDYQCPTWPNEPWRWLGIHGRYALADAADRLESSRYLHGLRGWR